MFLPYANAITYDAALSHSSQWLAAQKANSTTGDWSSTIGIVTAVIGNVLISFALNTQRFAHLRLEREQRARESGDEEQRLLKQSDRTRGNHSNGNDYGTTRRNLSDELSGRQQEPRRISEEHEDEDDRDLNEQDTLLRRPRNDKRSSNSSTESSSSEKKSYLRSPYWWLGITLMILGESGNFLAYGFAPASIVSPLGVVALVSNCLIAPLFLHEQFRIRDLVGVIIAIGGAVTVVLSAKGSNPKLGPDEIWDLIKRWEFLTYFGITLFLAIILMSLSSRYGHRTIAIDIGLVGLVGGYTALSTKGVASLLSHTLWRALTFPLTYLLVLILVVTAILQIKYVNRALQHFDSTQVIPTQFVWFTISVVIGSAVLYRDFESATAAQLGKFVGGCALTFAGVWLLTSGRQSKNTENRNSQSNEANDEDDQDATYDDQDEDVSPSDTDRVKLTDSESSELRPPPIPTLNQKSNSIAAVPQLSSNSNSKRRRSAGPQGSLTPSASNRSSFAASSSLTPTATASTSHSNTARTPPPSLTQSNSYLRPGPFTSPLSSSLSTVVADQRRRLLRSNSTSTRASPIAANNAERMRGVSTGDLRAANHIVNGEASTR